MRTASAIAPAEPSGHPDSLRAEFYLCLARAFLAPASETQAFALREHLAEDLLDLSRALGYPADEAVQAYREAIAQVPDAPSLLALYSRLFLVPGDAHPSINAAAYLDGAIFGDTVFELMDCYARRGLEKREDLADLPDHVSVQLEFAALLFADEAAGRGSDAERDAGPDAREFLGRYVARWAAPLRRDLESAGVRFQLAANPWLALARILETAASADTAAATGAERPEPELTEIERLRRQYASRTLDASDMAIIRARLAEDGLATDHVAIPAQDRDAAHGFVTLTPPAPQRHHRKAE